MNVLQEFQTRLETLRNGKEHPSALSLDQVRAIATLTEIGENPSLFPQIDDITLRKCMETLGPRMVVDILREHLPSPSRIAPESTSLSLSVWDKLPSSLAGVGSYLREFLRIPVEYLVDLIPVLEPAPAIFGGEAIVDEVGGIVASKVTLSHPTRWKSLKFAHPETWPAFLISLESNNLPLDRAVSFVDGFVEVQAAAVGPAPSDYRLYCLLDTNSFLTASQYEFFLLKWEIASEDIPAAPGPMFRDDFLADSWQRALQQEGWTVHNKRAVVYAVLYKMYRIVQDFLKPTPKQSGYLEAIRPRNREEALSTLRASLLHDLEARIHALEEAMRNFTADSA